MSRFTAAIFLFLSFSCSPASELDIQAWIDEQVENGAVLAVTAVHLQDDEATFFAGGRRAPGTDGLPDASSQFEIGSITKAFTNLLLAELVEQDKVAYDTTIGELLGEDIEFANEAVASVSLLQLATHTSGLPRLPANLAPTDQLDPYKGYDEAALLTGVAGTRDKQPLGHHYAYSNFGVGLLGYLLGRVHGGGYEVALTELVLQPLGLENTGFERADESVSPFRSGKVVKDWTFVALAGAGGLRSSTRDLAAVARVMLGALDNPLAHDLDADRIVVSEAGGFDITRVWHVGQSPDGKIFWHNGGTGGFWSFFGFKPATNEAAAILVSGDPDPTGLGLRWLGFASPRPPAGDIDSSIFGQYDLNPNFGIGVYEMRGVLVAQASGQMPLGLHRIDDDWYAMDVADASLRFIREDDAVVALELAQNGMLQRAAKTSDTAAALAKTATEVTREELAAFVGQPFFPVFAKGDDKFFYKVVDAELHFERDDEGKVNALVLHQGGIVQRAEKVN